eukprot:11103417-Ditylum_brightwellii.AAC.1
MMTQTILLLLICADSQLPLHLQKETVLMKKTMRMVQQFRQKLWNLLRQGQQQKMQKIGN